MKFEENQEQSQIIAGECLPSRSLSLITKIVLTISATTNDSPNLAYHFLTAFNDLKSENIKSSLGKRHAGACTNIEQKPSGATLNGWPS